jgi:hypothetical protein
VVTAIVTGALMVEREADFIGLQATVLRLESRMQALEDKLGQDLSGQRRPPGQSQ